MTAPSKPSESEPRLARERVPEAIASYNASIDARNAILDAAVRPAVDGQAEFTRSITTLASAALLLSVSWYASDEEILAEWLRGMLDGSDPLSARSALATLR